MRRIVGGIPDRPNLIQSSFNGVAAVGIAAVGSNDYGLQFVDDLNLILILKIDGIHQ